ncbi:MAG TPA: protein kinase [Solirubrobacter sp.]|nr:protein kinase [Solirubrobacter sp.]
MTDVLEGAHIAGCRIESVAGRGGMGIVYRATQISLGRPVALKLIAPEHAADAGFRERFQRESRMAAAIDHPNVIPVYEAGEEDGRLYLVMRWVAGTDLHRLLRSQGRLEPARAAAIVCQVAGALDAAHAAGLVHRDVKPANVLLSGDHVYLADFGLTRLAGADTQLTTDGHFLGTVDYMAPEQFHPGPNDARADVYALGCVLFAALTGAPPFIRDTVPATMLAHLHDPLPRPSDAGAPPAFDRVLARALAKAPEDRYPSAGDFGRATLAAAEGRSVTAEERSVARGAAAPTIRRPEPEPPPDAAPIRTYRTRPRRGWVILAAVLALAVAAVMVAFARGDGVPPPGSPVSEGEVKRLANSFANAYADEDPARLTRLLTADAQRVTPAGRQSGRADVVDVYESQFAANTTTGFELSDLEAHGGPAGRATARYRATYAGAGDATGTMTWDVIRDRGKPRIALLAIRPD